MPLRVTLWSRMDAFRDTDQYLRFRKAQGAGGDFKHFFQSIFQRCSFSQALCTRVSPPGLLPALKFVK